MGFLAASLLIASQAAANTYTNPKLLDLSEIVPALVARLKLKPEPSLPALYPLEAAAFGEMDDKRMLIAALNAYGYKAAVGENRVLAIFDHNKQLGGNHRPPDRVIRSALRAIRKQGEAYPVARNLGRQYHFPDGRQRSDLMIPKLKLARIATRLSPIDAPLSTTEDLKRRGFLAGWVTEIEEGYRVNGTWLNLVDPPKEEVWFECSHVPPLKSDPESIPTKFELSFAAIDSEAWKVWQAWTVSQHRTGWFDPVKAMTKRGFDPKLVTEERVRSPWQTLCSRLSLKSEKPALLVLDDAWLPTMVNLSDKQSLWPQSANCGLAVYGYRMDSYPSVPPCSVLTSNLEGRPEGDYYTPPRQSLYLSLKKHKGSITSGFPGFGSAGLYADYSLIEAGIVARATDQPVGWSVREWPAVKALSARPTPWLPSGELDGESDHIARYAIDRTYFFSREVMAETLGTPQSVKLVFTNPEKNVLSEARRIIYFPTERMVIVAKGGNSTPRALGANIPSTISDYALRVASVLYEDPNLKLESLLDDLKFVVIKEPVVRLQLAGTKFFTDVPTTALPMPTSGFASLNDLGRDVAAEVRSELERAVKSLGRRKINP